VTGGRQKKALALVGALVLLLLLPIGFGEANRSIPIIGGAEKQVDDHCLTVLTRAVKANSLIYTLDGVLAVLKSAGLNVGLLGLGASVSPGEALSAPHDSIKSLGSLLTSIILTMLVAKQATGMMTYLCFKIFLPISLICFLIHFASGRWLRVKRIGFLLLKTGLILWIALPVTALVSQVIDKRYVSIKYEAHAETLNEKIEAVIQLGGLKAAQEEGNVSLWDMAKLGFRSLKIAKEGQEEGVASERSIQELTKLMGEMLNLLLVMYSLLVLTAYVVPLVVLGLLFGVLLIITGNTSDRKGNGRALPSLGGGSA